MSANLLQGKIIANEIKDNLKKEVERLKKKHDCAPALAALQVGEDQASAVYLKSQLKAAERLGIDFKLHKLDAGATEEDLIDHIKRLNQDDGIHGIILQLPLPKHISAKSVILHVDPAKDAEGMHPTNLGRVLLGHSLIGPCTAMAAMTLIASTKVDLYGKEAVVVGHSDIVGKPVSLMLLNRFVTVTTRHIATGEKGVLA